MDKNIIERIRSMPREERVGTMKEMIELAGITCGLNLTIHEGRIGFVDQKNRRIVGLWDPEYRMTQEKEETSYEE